MGILVTGATGTIGSQVLAHLAGQAVEIRALTRSPASAQLPAGVTPVGGDLADVDSLRAAIKGIDTVFLLAPNVPDELTQAMLALSVARESDIKGIVYLSVFKADAYTDVPHFAGKYTVERMIEDLGIAATVLRPAYFIQNDLRLEEPLQKFGVYAMPIGSQGVSMVDVRDIGEAAAIELLRRHRAPAAMPRETFSLVGPDALTGAQLATIWDEALGRRVRYGGDDLDAMEQRLKGQMPSWHAMDLRLMLNRYQTDGARASAADRAHLTRLLGRAPRSYRAFAQDAAALWAKA